MSYSCGFYDLKSDDTDPFQNIGATQQTDRENLKNIFVIILKTIRELQNKVVSKTIAASAKNAAASGEDPIVVPSKNALALDSVQMSIKSKEKSEKSIFIPIGLSIISGSLQNIDKELVLFKREFVSPSPEIQQSAMYEKHRKLQVLYIGLAPARYELSRILEKVKYDVDGEIEESYSEESYQTVIFILGDPDKSHMPKKLSFSYPVTFHTIMIYG